MRSDVTPKEFIDAWKAEVAAGGTPEGVSERLDGRMSAKACVSRAFTYRKKREIDLPMFEGGGRSYDWDELRDYAGKSADVARSTRKVAKAKKAPVKKGKRGRKAK